MTGFIKRSIVSAGERARRLLSSAIALVAVPFAPKTIKLCVVEGQFPRQLKIRTLYILTENGDPWQASMLCPCGCGKTLELNLLPDERPVWRYWTDRRGRPTLHPSVWRQVGCRSHFWLRDGRVDWV